MSSGLGVVGEQRGIDVKVSEEEGHRGTYKLAIKNLPNLF